VTQHLARKLMKSFLRYRRADFTVIRAGFARNPFREECVGEAARAQLAARRHRVLLRCQLKITMEIII
jgi:hypothetical protein